MRAWGDDRIQRFIGKLLRWGVALAAASILAGGILYLDRCGGAVPDYGVFRGEPPELTGVPGIAREALSLNPLGLIQFGLLLLIATPLVRVAFSVAAFALQRDGVYVMVTLFVLAVVLHGLARQESKTVIPPDAFRPMCVPSDASSRSGGVEDFPDFEGEGFRSERLPEERRAVSHIARGASVAFGETRNEKDLRVGAGLP
ncbi:MAG: hypothetical protein H6Q84_2337 [Deltaproteobacteria bacterium]|nr:hypothetical protein [Deltaproteobacteria bacterium]